MSNHRLDSHEGKQALETELLKQLKARLPELEALLEKSDSHWHGEDMLPSGWAAILYLYRIR